MSLQQAQPIIAKYNLLANTTRVAMNKHHTNYPSGASVVTQVNRDNGLPTNDPDYAVRQAGHTGVIIVAPSDASGRYVVEFADGVRLEYTHEELRSRRRSLDELLESERRPPEYYLEFVGYECVVGSTAFGLATDTSDEDVRGFFVAPAEEFMGLPQLAPPGQIEGKKDPVTKKPLEGEDWVYWELAKYVELLLKANPSVLETLYTPLVRKTSVVAERLREIRSTFLSKQIANTYSGYAISQMERIEHAVMRPKMLWDKWRAKCAEARSQHRRMPEPPDVPDEVDETAYRGKHAMHLVRLLYAGEHALRTGELLVEVSAELRDELLDLRYNPPPITELRERIRTQIRERFNPALEATRLPEQPDWDAAHKFLVWARSQARMLELEPLELDTQHVERTRRAMSR